MTNFTWDERAIATLRKMRDDGDSYSIIAEALGCSRNAAIGKGQRLGLTEPRSRRIVRNRKDRANTPWAKSLPVVKIVKPVEKPPAQKTSVPFKELPKANVALPESRLISIMDLRNGVCRWPLGDPRDKAFAFCGADCDPARSYCEPHRRLSFSPGTVSEQNAAKVKEKHLAA